jgi:RNA polymerase-binding transcription factor DksA
MEQSRLEGIKRALELEMQHVERQLAEYGAAVDQPGVEVTIDEGFADSAQATAERSEIVSTIEHLHGTHREVAQALARIERGTYGKCEGCGQDIPIERLEALPTASLCVTCKSARS